MTIRAVFLTIPIALFSFIASANEFKSNWIACVSEEAYDAYGEAMHADDRVGMAELKLKGLCINTDKLWGFQVVVLKQGLLMLKVRATRGGDTFILYTSTGAVRS